MRVLVVKTSSLGDIIHTLPALSDAKRRYPDISFDWVVEEAFQEVPRWHPAVNRVIPVALRRWRQQGFFSRTGGQVLEFLRDLRSEQYDVILDAQGLLKSVAITLASRGTRRVGLSWRSARESLASLFYQKRVVVLWGPHAVLRARALFAGALGYVVPEGPANYGIVTERFLGEFPSQKPYYVFLHGTTWETKHWPEAYWIALGEKASETGYAVQLLWGNAVELARALRIAKAVPGAAVAPNRLSLGEIAGVLAGAAGIVTVDTGLGHLAAALGVKTVSLYGPTDPAQSGTLGEKQTNLAVTFECAPCFSRVCQYQGKKDVDPPCFKSLSPDRVWEYLS